MAYDQLRGWDIGVFVAYFVLVMAVGLVATWKAQRGTTQGFFLAGMSMTFIPIAGSIFATNIGAPSFVGLAGSAATNGFAPIMFEWHGELYAGSLFINRILGWDVYLSTVLILTITAIYTIGGGLAAVIYTDTLQAGILIFGALFFTGLSLNKVGGYEAMITRFMESAANTTYLTQAQYGNLSCGFPPEHALHIFQDVDSNYPWPGLVFGLTILATHFFCTNQVIVQRNLSAKSVTHSKAACVLVSYLKFLPFFLFVWPGMISRILFPDEIACTDPDVCYATCQNRNGCTNIAYPILVLRLLPDGEKEVVVVGRVFGLVMIGFSIAWLPILHVIQGSQLWDYLQAIFSYVTLPWVIVFLLGMFWKRTTEQGAFWGLMAGLVTGVCRMGIHFAYPTPTCGGAEEETRPEVFTQVHYLHFALILGVITLVVTMTVSLITSPRCPEQLRMVTWWTRKDEQELELSDDEIENEIELKQQQDKEAYIPPDELSWAQNCYNTACGFKNLPPPCMTKVEQAELRRKLTNIDEDPFWQHTCDVNAVIAIAGTCFIIGFYG